MSATPFQNPFRPGAGHPPPYLAGREDEESGMKPFSSSHVNQMLATLGDSGLVYKNRYGKYAFAVPLLGAFIRRQQATLN